MSPRPIFLVIGTLLTILGAGMIIPALVDLYYNNPDWKSFAASSFVTVFVGMGLVISNQQHEHQTLNIKQAFILTTASWLVLVIFACLPFVFSELDISVTDAFFESMSGLTTTGATVFTGLDFMPPGILLWRSILQWLGGVGIIVMALAVLPMLKIGGMQLFRAESSDNSDKILPRVTQVAGAISLVYVGFTIICGILLYIAGMSLFDAVNHAMTTIATSGFSTHDKSIGFFDNANIEMIMIGFMILSGIPYVLYIQAMRGRPSSLLKDSQTRIFLLLLIFSVTAIYLWFHAHGFSDENAFRKAAFNVVSVTTTTGFSTADYNQWGSFAFLLMFLLAVVGGCTGSTTGGIKIFRFEILWRIARSQVHQLVQPHGVFRPTYKGRSVSDGAISSVSSFFILFAFCFCILALLLSMMGLDYVTAMSGAASMLANLGPGLGDIIGPTGNYSSLDDSVKWVLTFGMLLGRLELFTVLILFSKYFWRD